MLLYRKKLKEHYDFHSPNLSLIEGSDYRLHYHVHIVHIYDHCHVYDELRE
jgi:hypothetical protein